MLKNIDNGTLELVVPPLHTLLGMVNRLQKHNKSLMTDAQAAEMYEKWLQPAGIGPAPYFAGTYEGNALGLGNCTCTVFKYSNLTFAQP